MAKISHPDLLKRLRKLSKAITAQIEYVNCGGCGIVAHLVAEELQAHDRMVEVVTPCGDWRGLPAAEARRSVTKPNSPRDWDSNGLSRTHLAVRFRSGGKTYTWDSDGTLCRASAFGADAEYSTTARFGDGLTVAEAKAICKPQTGWNRRFDRKQVPLLRHLVAHYLRYGL